MIGGHDEEEGRSRNFNREFNLAVQASLERFAQATAEHLKAHPTLTKIAQSKIHPDYQQSNYLQQAGRSAEVKSTTRINADAIVSGSGRRVARTDDVGLANHPTFDHVEVDGQGVPLRDPSGNFQNGVQMKVHKSIEGYRDLCGSRFEKYRPAKLSVPSDQIDGIRADWNGKLDSLQRQRCAVTEQGKLDVANKLDNEIANVQDALSRLEDSGVTTQEAMEARKNPILSTTKDVLRLSHKAGVESAKTGAVVGGSMSILRNVMALGRKQKTATDTLTDVAKDTGSAALTSYVTSATAAMLGGALKSTSNQFCQNLAKGSGPAAILQAGVIVSTHTFRLARGEMSTDHFTKSLANEGAVLVSSMTGASLGAALGTMMMPGVGTLVGGVIGGMVATMLCNATLTEIKMSRQLTALSAEQRAHVEYVCNSLIWQEQLYRRQLVEVFDEFFTTMEAEIELGIESIAMAIRHRDSLEPGLRCIGNALGLELRFDSVDAFRKHLAAGDTLVL